VQQFVNEETIVVDLDRNSVMFGEHTPPLPALPGKKWSKLQSSVQQITGHLFWRTRGLETEYRQFSAGKLSQWNFKRIARQKGDVRWNEKLETFDHAFNLQFTPDSENLKDAALEREQHQWDRLQESFLRFFVAVLKDYRKFLTIPKSDALLSPEPGAGDWLGWSKRRSFDGEGFIAAQKQEYLAYLSEFCGTQQFDDFITRRLYSPEMPDLIFFDQSIDAKLNRSRLKLKKVDTPFLQSAKTHKTLKSFKAIEPNAADLPTKLEHDTKAPFMYKTWPETFDSSLFCKARPIPTMITAEFDRQKALSSRLRAHHSPGMETVLEKKSEILDFYGSDYDTSPETMAFTVFFFTYSSVIGREWETYQKKRRELDAGRREILERDAETAAHQEGEIPQVHSSGVEVADQDLMADLSLGMCDACPEGDTSVNNTMIYVSQQSPCPRYANELNSQAQEAYDVISQMAQSPFGEVQQQREVSLLDNDDGLAEYEEAREVAVAQLDLAFDTLKSLGLRGLSTDPDVFKSLMEACGRCGDTTRALELIQTMKRDGLVADKEILSCFVATFSHGETGCVSPMKDDFIMGPGRHSDAYSSFLKKKLEGMGGDATAVTASSAEEDVLSDMLSDSGSSCVSGASSVEKPAISNPLFEWLTPHKKQKPKKTRKRRKNKKPKNPSNLPITDRLLKQIVLGESLLDFLYPDLKLEAGGDTCPQCSTVMNEDNIISGWQPSEFQDYTTKCPNCQHRFVPRFSVSCSSPTFKGSQGPGTPLFCEFLSPWVLRKELNHVILGENGIDMMLDPEWRSGTDIRATLWWNLIVMCNRYRLPFSFLLQGSFQNRLINPVPQD
jgi:pentatricopeptide repeat protein